MDDKHIEREARLQARLEALGCNDPKCGMCPEDNPHCLERHHVAGRLHDAVTVFLCRNCHRKVTDDQKDHPRKLASGDPMLEAVGRFLLGLADMLRIIVTRLAEFGADLIDRARLEAAQ